MVDLKKLWIGIKNDKACDSKVTKEQIKSIKKFPISITYENKKLNWAHIDNLDEPRSLFQSIIKDRELRIDKRTLMADRPKFAVCTIEQGKVIRIEFYEGHNRLEKTFDLGESGKNSYEE